MGACQGPHEVGTLSLVPTPVGVEVLSIVLYAFLQSSVCIFAIAKKCTEKFGYYTMHIIYV